MFTDNYLYAATDGGVARSSDGGATWINISNGLDIMQFYDIDVKGSRIIGGTQDNGTSVWHIGDPVAVREIGADGFESMFHPTNNNIMYGCTQETRHKTIDNGANWTNITPPGDESTWDASWIMHPTNPDTMYCARKDFHRTYDGGTTWSFINVVRPTNELIRAMGQSASNPNRLYASDRESLVRTDNVHIATPSWGDITGLLPIGPGQNQLGGIAVDPDNSDRLWVTMRGYDNAKKVYYSHNAGGTWTKYLGHTAKHTYTLCGLSYWKQ